MSQERTDWPEMGRQLAARFPRSSLHPEVCRWVDSHSWASPAGVACSGGADSLCLLLLLWAHFPERRTKLLVLHFDHRLRGRASEADAQFVEDLARGLDLEVRTGAWARRETDPVSEGAARTARFAFFQEQLGARGASQTARAAASILFLGHQRDDIVESQLMRLSRGSGTAGLAAPRPVQEFADGRVHLRPLLSLPGAEIREALAELEIPFRIDASNETLDFYRNRIRLEVLPLWQNHSPFDVSAGAAVSRELLQEDAQALEAWLRELLPSPVPGQPLDLRPLAGKPRALLRRALREWLAGAGVGDSLSKAAFDGLLEAARENEAFRMSAGNGLFLEIGRDRILQKTTGAALPLPAFKAPWPLPLNGLILLPGHRRLRARAFSLDSASRSRILSGRVESHREAFLACQGEELLVRNWRSGDRFRPLGAPGSRKLQDMFVDLKIPEGERYRLPVVLKGDRIVWMPGLPPAETLKINHLTKAVVQLTYDCGKAV